MPEVKRTLKIKTSQHVNPNKESPQPGYAMRDWSIEVYILNQNDNSLHPADCYEKATYKLHPSFGAREKQVIRQPPFRCAEEGWGEFELSISLTAKFKGGEHTIGHDLNFQEEEYEATHPVTFRNPKPELLDILRATGPVPGEANGVANKTSSAKKRSKTNNVDMDKLAEGLQRLGEDDLLNIVQMIHEQKSTDTYTKNDVENGEFHVDLYTLPDGLVKNLWDFVAQRVPVDTL